MISPVMLRHSLSGRSTCVFTSDWSPVLPRFDQSYVTVFARGSTKSNRSLQLYGTAAHPHSMSSSDVEITEFSYHWRDALLNVTILESLTHGAQASFLTMKIDNERTPRYLYNVCGADFMVAPLVFMQCTNHSALIKTHCSVSRDSRKNRTRGLCIWMLTIMHLLATAHLAARWNFVREAFIVHGATAESTYDYLSTSPRWMLTSSVAFSSNTLIADCILVSR